MATNKDGKEEWPPQNRETEGTRTEAIERKATTAKKRKTESSSKDPAWKTGGEWVGERKQDGNSGEKVAKGRDRWTI